MDEVIYDFISIFHLMKMWMTRMLGFLMVLKCVCNALCSIKILSKYICLFADIDMNSSLTSTKQFLLPSEEITVGGSMLIYIPESLCSEMLHLILELSYPNEHASYDNVLAHPLEVSEIESTTPLCSSNI